MAAAKTNNEEAVGMLLRKNANPDIVVMVKKSGSDKDFHGFYDEDHKDEENKVYEEEEEYTALIYAIESGNLLIIIKLFDVTNIGMKISFEKLAESTIDWSSDENVFNKLKSIIKKKIENDNGLFEPFFKCSVINGNKIWINFLRTGFPHQVKKLGKEKLKKLLKDVIYSDDTKACQELVDDEHFTIDEEVKCIAKSCGKTEVIKVFEAQNEGTDESNDTRIFKDVIKSEEFQYANNILKLINKFLAGKKVTRKILVKMNDLVENMKALPVHYNTTETNYSLEEEDCPEICTQKRICLRIRQTQQLIKDMLNKIGEKYPIFKDPELIVVGSDL